MTRILSILVLLLLGLSSTRSAMAQRRSQRSERVRRGPIVPPMPLIEPSGGCEVASLPNEVVASAGSEHRLVASSLHLGGAETVSIASNPQGGRALVGSFREQIQIGAHTENQSAMGAFVAMLSSTGEVQWARSWSTDSDVSVPVVAVAADGTVVLACLTGASAIFVEGTEVPAASAFIARWSSDGTLLGVSVLARRSSGARAYAPSPTEIADTASSGLALSIGADASVTIAGALESGAAVVHIQPNGAIRRTKISDEYPHAFAVSDDGSAAFAFVLPETDPNRRDPHDRIVRIGSDGAIVSTATLQGTTHSLAIGEGITTAMVQTYSGLERVKAAAWSADGSLQWEIEDRQLARTFVHAGNVYVVHLNYSLDQHLMVRSVSRDGQQTDFVGFPVPLSPRPDVAFLNGSGSLVHFAWTSIPRVHPHCSSVPRPDWMSVDLSPLFR